jgi:hypothetical protein
VAESIRGILGAFIITLVVVYVIGYITQMPAYQKGPFRLNLDLITTAILLALPTGAGLLLSRLR